MTIHKLKTAGALAAVVLAAGLGLTACGGSSTASSSNCTPSTRASRPSQPAS